MIHDKARVEPNASVPAACRYWEPALQFEGIWLGLRSDNKGIVALNESSRILWDALCNGKTLEAVIRRCENELSTDRAWVERAIINLITQCEEFGLLDKRARGGDVRLTEPRIIPVLAKNLVVNGRAVRVETDSTLFADLLAEVVADFDATPIEPPDIVSVMAHADGQFTVAARGYCDQLAQSMGHARTILVNRLLQIGIGSGMLTARLHGATLVAPSGQCVVFCGDGGSGKSTLAYALARAGWRLVSEDITPLDAQMRAVPFPFPISVKSGAWPLVIANDPAFQSAPTFRMFDRTIRYYHPATEAFADKPIKPDIFIHVSWSTSAAVQVFPVKPNDTFAQFLSDDTVLDFDRAGLADFMSLLSDTRHIAISYGSTADAISTIERSLGYGASEA